MEANESEDKVRVIIIIKQAVDVDNVSDVSVSVSSASASIREVSLTLFKSYWQDNVAALPMMTASGTNIFRSFSPWAAQQKKEMKERRKKEIRIKVGHVTR